MVDRIITVLGVFRPNFFLRASIKFASPLMKIMYLN